MKHARRFAFRRSLLLRAAPALALPTAVRFVATEPWPRAHRDPWATLGVEPTNDLDEVKAAYRRLAMRLHPDVSGDEASATRFAEVVRAYEAIVDGDAADAPDRRRASSSMRGVRVVGGVLVASIDELRRDAGYRVYALQLALDREAAAVPPPATGGAAASGDGGGASPECTALGTETVQLVHASEWDSVGDVRRLVQAQLELPGELRYEHARHNEGGHELIAPGGVLLGEHLFLSDYGLRDGDVLHFAVNLARQGKRGSAQPE